MPTSVVGITGYAQVGKDTCGDALVAEGWTRMKFADPLRDFLYIQNPCISHQATDTGPYRKGTVRLQDIVDLRGWEKAKEMYEVRRLLQVTGADCVRELLGRDCLVNALYAKINRFVHSYPDRSPRFVITDVRFPNEAEMLQTLDAVIIRVVRPGFKPCNDHSSDTSVDLINADEEIVNDGTIPELKAKMLKQMRERFNEGSGDEIYEAYEASAGQ